MTSRTKLGTVALVFINFAAALALLLATENILQRLGGGFDPRTSRSVNLSEYGSDSEGILIPTPSQLARTDSLEFGHYKMRTDADGFIQPSNRHKNPDVSIVFLGGSTTATAFVPEGKRWPALVADLLEGKTGLAINTANSGRAGNHSMHSNILLMAKILPMKPNIVVMLHNINDFGILHNEESYWNGNLRRGIIADKNHSLPVQVFRFFVHLKNEYFPNIYYATRRLLNLERFGQTMNPTENWSNQKPLHPSHIKQAFRSSLETFVSISRVWGVTPVLMTQANRFRSDQNHDPTTAGKRQARVLQDRGLDEADFFKLYLEMNQIIRNVTQEENVGLIDLDKEIPKSPDYLYDMIHLNEAGSEYQARIVARSLRQILCGGTLRCRNYFG